MNFFSDSYYIKFDIGSLLVVFALVLILVAAFFFFRKRQKKSTPKTGFLGKPLIIQLGLVLMGLSVIAGGYFLSRENVQLSTEAEKEIQITFQKTLLSSDGDSYLMSFKTVPNVDGVEWGSDSDRFDIFWSIRPDDSTEAKGQKAVSFVEIGKNKNNISEVNPNLRSGNYTVKILISYESASYEHQETIKIP